MLLRSVQRVLRTSKNGMSEVGRISIAGLASDSSRDIGWSSATFDDRSTDASTPTSGEGTKTNFSYSLLLSHLHHFRGKIDCPVAVDLFSLEYRTGYHTQVPTWKLGQHCLVIAGTNSGLLYPTHTRLSPLQKGAVAVLSAFGAAFE